jgi:hypothetical protein
LTNQSVVAAIRTAVDRKKMPSFIGGDVRDLAQKLGMPFPVSFRELLRILEDLPPAVVTIDISSVATPGGVNAYGQVGLQSDGAASFRGTVNSAGPGGIDYTYTVVLLDILDDDGNAIAFSKSGNLYNAVQASTAEFQQDMFCEYIAKNWDRAKTTGWYADIEDSDNAWEDLVQGLLTALAVVATVGGVLLIPDGSSGPDQNPWGCSWGAGPGSSMTGCYRTN